MVAKFMCDVAFFACQSRCALPAIPGIKTNVGGSLNGFYITTTGSKPERSAIMVHLSDRDGSEGCVSMKDDKKWDDFNEDMRIARTHPKTPKKELFFSVTYQGAQPEFYRNK